MQAGVTTIVLGTCIRESEVEVEVAGLSGTRAGSSEITAPGSASTLGSVRASPSGFLLAP